MISYRRMTDEELDREVEERIEEACNEVFYINDETIPPALLSALVATIEGFDWEGLLLSEHAEAYEDYKMNNKGY